MKTQKAGTPDLREKLTNDMVARVVKICKGQGHTTSKALIIKHVNSAIDQYIDDWYEVSLEAMDLMEGEADFVTDEKIDDPEVIKEVKLRVVKNMHEDRPDGLHEQIAKSVMEDIDNQAEGEDGQAEEVDREAPEVADQTKKTENNKNTS
ncbi:MAG: hypothetical protein C0399_10410 [Syntrophus sp. (in: bacteria)]|nr:hypothetical protein [Syntrophus sp. (in: bacteria)]